MQGIIHKERYADYSTTDISNLYKEKEELPANINFVKENGKDSLAQVFTDVRYSKENNETFSKIFFDFIEQQGFKFSK